MKYGTTADVKSLSGVEPGDLGLDTDANGDPSATADADLDALIDSILERVGGAINVRLPREIVAGDGSIYDGIVGVSVQFATNLLTAAKNVRAAGIVRLNEFVARQLDSTDATKRLDEEVEPYARRLKRLDAVAEGRDSKITMFVAGRP